MPSDIEKRFILFFMKNTFYLVFCFLLSFANLNAKEKKPAWLTSEPQDDVYQAIGTASLTETDYLRKAEENALSELAKQISVVVNEESFLTYQERNNNGVVSSADDYQQQTQLSVKTLIEGYKRVGDYTDKKSKTYYVCYSLNKLTYKMSCEKKQREISDRCLSFLKQASVAEVEGQLIRAMQLYEQGLKQAEPWLFLELSGVHNNMKVNLPVVLLQSYMSVLDNLKLEATPTQVEIADGQDNVNITIILTRNKTAIANIPINAVFAEGSGNITSNAKTDSEGKAVFTLKSLTGKQQNGELLFSIDRSIQNDLPQTYRQYISQQTWPTVRVIVTKQATAVKTAYLNIKKGDMPAAEKQIRAILANNHFSLTADPTEAEVFIDMKTELEVAGTVKGEMYDLNECLVSLQMDFYNYLTNQLLFTYSVNQLRVLTPQSATVEQTTAQCTRELMKKVQKELPKKL